MRRIQSFSVVSCLALSLVVSSPAHAAPKGSVWVDKSRAKNIGSTVCAKIYKQSGNTGFEVWTAGKWVNKKNGQFISYNSLSANAATAAKKAKGNKKKTLIKQSASYSKLSKTYTPKCKKVNALKVNTKSKAGLAKISGSTGSSFLASVSKSGKNLLLANGKKYSSLMAVGMDGKLTEGITNFAAMLESFGNCNGCAPTVSGILAGPNDDIFIIFSQALNINDISNPYGSNGTDQDRCSVAVAHKGSETLDCMDWDLQNLTGRTQGTTGSTAIQFDDAGNAYYAGYFTRNGTSYSGIRRATPAGKIKDVVKGPDQSGSGGFGLNVSSFVVMPQGDMIVVGNTNRGSNNESWVKLYRTTGGQELLSSGSWGNGFLRLFPDGNVYFSEWGGGSGNQLLVFDSSTLTVRDNAFLGDAKSEYRYSDFCGKNTWECQSVVTQYGSMITELDFGTSADSDNSIFGLNSNSAENSKILEVFPTPRLISTGINQTRTIEGAGNVIVVSGIQKTLVTGTRYSFEYRVNIINPDTDEVTPVVGALGIDVYTLAYNSANNTVLLSGQRTSDSAIVTGTINLTSAKLTVTTSSYGRVDDIEIFQN